MISVWHAPVLTSMFCRSCPPQPWASSRKVALLRQLEAADVSFAGVLSKNLTDSNRYAQCLTLFFQKGAFSRTLENQ